MEKENLEDLIKKYNVQIKDIRKIKYSLKKCANYKEYKAMYIDGLAKIEDTINQIEETLKQIETDPSLPFSIQECANYTSEVSNYDEVLDHNYMAISKAKSEIEKDYIDKIIGLASQLDKLRTLANKLYNYYNPAEKFPYTTYSYDTFNEIFNNIKRVIKIMGIGSAILAAIEVYYLKIGYDVLMNNQPYALPVILSNIIPIGWLGYLVWSLAEAVQEYKKQKIELDKFKEDEEAYKYRRIN